MLNANLIAARISRLSMNSPSAQFVSSRRMSVYDPIHQIGMWGETFKSNGNLSASLPLIDEADLKFDSQVIFYKFLLSFIGKLECLFC